MLRLNYRENGEFTFAWLDLWTAVVHILCFKEKERADIGENNRALNESIIDSPEHDDCRQKRAVHEVHTNQKLKYMKVAEMCKRINERRIKTSFDSLFPSGQNNSGILLWPIIESSDSN